MDNLLEMFADESYGGNNAVGPLCLAMYLYEKRESVDAAQEWLKVLNDPELPRPLPYFRTTDCAHSNGVFKGMGEQGDRIQRKIIPIIKQRSIVGFSATVDQGEFANIMPSSKDYPNPYTFLAQMIFGFIQNWIEANNFSGKIFYNFEHGHRHQSDADRIMKEMKIGIHGSTLANSFSGYAFPKKHEVPLLQSADLLAWHSFTDFKRQNKRLGSVRIWRR